MPRTTEWPSKALNPESRTPRGAHLPLIHSCTPMLLPTPQLRCLGLRSSFSSRIENLHLPQNCLVSAFNADSRSFWPWRWGPGLCLLCKPQVIPQQEVPDAPSSEKPALLRASGSRRCLPSPFPWRGPVNTCGVNEGPVIPNLFAQVPLLWVKNVKRTMGDFSRLWTGSLPSEVPGCFSWVSFTHPFRGMSEGTGPPLEVLVGAWGSPCVFRPGCCSLGLNHRTELAPEAVFLNRGPLLQSHLLFVPTLIYSTKMGERGQGPEVCILSQHPNLF